MMLVRLVYVVFNLLALGLLVYSLSSWVDHPAARAIQERLRKLYGPFLKSIQDKIKPVRIGGSTIDFSAAVLLVIIMLLRGFVATLLVVP
jgi:uncharacterized protein YggT (Ycf19 family)